MRTNILLLIAIVPLLIYGIWLLIETDKRKTACYQDGGIPIVQRTLIGQEVYCVYGKTTIADNTL